MEWRRSRRTATPARKCGSASGKYWCANIGRMFRTTGLQIGYRYEDSPICVPDGTPPSPTIRRILPPRRVPVRAHRICGSTTAARRSISMGATSCCFASAPMRPMPRFEIGSSARRVPFEIVTVTDPSAVDLYEHRLVLVRPDGHVAWRANEDAAGPGRDHRQSARRCKLNVNEPTPFSGGAFQFFAGRAHRRFVADAVVEDLLQLLTAGFGTNATSRDGRFSNRPFGVNVAHGLVLLFGIGAKALPSWDSKTRRNNL